MESVDCMPACRLESERPTLEPLRPRHAEKLAPVLNDVSLHRFTGGEPIGVKELRARFTRQVIGRSPDGRQSWLNWIVLERLADHPIGTVRATAPVTSSASSRNSRGSLERHISAEDSRKKQSGS